MPDHHPSENHYSYHHLVCFHLPLTVVGHAPVGPGGALCGNQCPPHRRPGWQPVPARQARATRRMRIPPRAQMVMFIDFRDQLNEWGVQRDEANRPLLCCARRTAGTPPAGTHPVVTLPWCPTPAQPSAPTRGLARSRTAPPTYRPYAGHPHPPSPPHPPASSTAPGGGGRPSGWVEWEVCGVWVERCGG